MAAAPVVMLASGITISQLTAHASRRVEGQRGGAGGAFCEDARVVHLVCVLKVKAKIFGR